MVPGITGKMFSPVTTKQKLAGNSELCFQLSLQKAGGRGFYGNAQPVSLKKHWGTFVLTPVSTHFSWSKHVGCIWHRGLCLGEVAIL